MQTQLSITPKNKITGKVYVIYYLRNCLTITNSKISYNLMEQWFINMSWF